MDIGESGAALEMNVMGIIASVEIMERSRKLMQASSQKDLEKYLTERLRSVHRGAQRETYRHGDDDYDEYIDASTITLSLYAVLCDGCMMKAKAG